MAHPVPGSQYHAVQFYGTDERLYSTAANFLAEGLIAGEPAMIIASATHCEGMLGQLNARLIHVEHARKRGDLLVLDADAMLALFMIDGLPDASLFEINIGRFIDQVLQGRPGSILRAYGGMVDILWQQGQTNAAIRLEILWNAVAARFGLALLCGYAMGNFAHQQVAQFHDVCSHHTHIFGPEHSSPVLHSVTH